MLYFIVNIALSFISIIISGHDDFQYVQNAFINRCFYYLLKPVKKAELAEVLEESNFKWWKNHKPINEPALKEELVDVLHFFVSLCLRSGMDADELFERYCEKNKENIDRQYGRSSKPGYEVK